VSVVEESASVLAELRAIPISFWVTSVLEVEAADTTHGGFTLQEQAVATPYLKNYDDDPEDDPAGWPMRFDVSSWGVFGAWDGSRRVGSIVMAWNTPAVHMLEGRLDLGVVWDVRLHPESRRQGIGARLFRGAEAWLAERGCRLLKVETQNVNVPACRFYAKMGCTLGALNRFAYPKLLHETQLLWYKALPDSRSQRSGV
jgi:GNAT superfamily N-acetyltransferase